MNEQIKNIKIDDEAINGKVIWLLALVIMVQTVYPITEGNETASIILYYIIYTSMLVIGIFLAKDSRKLQTVMIITAALTLITGFIYAFYPTEQWALFLGYITIIPFQCILVLILLRFVFMVRTITRDILYAASTAYLLLGSVFVPLYGLLETISPGSFVDSASTGGPVYWQQFIYYSYTTITTLGHGDILPVTMWARSITSLEAIAGVLYITIIMARLVGMYATERRNGR